MSEGLFVGVLRVVLHVPGARSLKDGRQAFASLRDRIRSRFSVSVHEIPAGERPDRRIAVVTTGGADARAIRSALDQVRSLFESSATALVVAVDVDVFRWHPSDGAARGAGGPDGGDDE